MNQAAQALLLDHFSPQPADRVLLLESGAGDLAIEAARLVPNGQVLALNRDFRLARQAQERLQAYTHVQALLAALPQESDFDHVLLTLPKERRYTRSLLVTAWQALKPGGRLLLAGPTGSGAKAMISDAGRLFGQVVTLAYRAHQRVAGALRGPELPEPLPQEFSQAGIAPGSSYHYQLRLASGELVFETHPGIFSWQALDEGSALLLEHLKIQPGERVWDVGCGYGPLGLAAALAGAGQVYLSDVNLIAVDYARLNSSRNSLEQQVTVFPADGLEACASSPQAVDLILSNPAFHQGRQVDRSMADTLIAHAPAYLSPHGRILLVANRFLNYDQVLGSHFREVNRIAETSKYHLLEGRQPANAR